MFHHYDCQYWYGRGIPLDPPLVLLLIIPELETFCTSYTMSSIVYSIIFKPATPAPAIWRTWFLEIAFICTSVCVHVYVSNTEGINNQCCIMVCYRPYVIG